MCITVCLNLPRGGEKMLKVCDSKEQLKQITVGDLKTKIIEELKPEFDIRLIHRTVFLEDSSVLFSYGIRHMSTIHINRLLPGGGGPPEKGDGGMGDKEGKNRSMEMLSYF